MFGRLLLPQLRTYCQKRNSTTVIRVLRKAVALWIALLLAWFLPALPQACGQTGSQASGQGKEQIRQQADAQLRKMTPEEIERKLREAGLTVEEAARRAQDLGIPLEEYLQRQLVGTPEEAEPALYDPRLGFQRESPLKASRADSLRTRGGGPSLTRRFDVPGFKGRRGIDTLIQPFGYDLFRLSASTFEPSVNVATPPSYSLGAGDELTITVWGETRLSYRLTVNRDGNVIVPDVGPVPAASFTIGQFRDKLLRRMSMLYSGLRNGAADANTFLDVSLGKLKTIQIFVLGEVMKPGGYPIASMSTALHAMYLAGGPSVTGTLRDIRLLRNGQQVQAIDLYGFVVKGDRTKDINLQDGDVVFVKPAGKRVAVVGEVVRPAVYELRDRETLSDAIGLAAGLRFNAFAGRVHLERIVPFDRRNVYEKNILDADLKFDSLGALLRSPEPMEDGDIVTVFRIADQVQNRVIIAGNINRPGPFELKAGMCAGDLIRLADSLKRSTFAERGTIFRMLPNLRREVIGFNPRLALAGETRNNVPLANEDSVVVYPESLFTPTHTVTITGAVRRPGEYPRNEKMTVADLAVMAGGLVDGATTRGWEVSRFDTSRLNVYSRLYRLDLDSAYWGKEGQKGFELEDLDIVTVPFDPKYTKQKVVKVAGYVMYPGTYAIQYEGERLDNIFKRAGGFRQGSYLEGSRLIRRFNNAGLIPLDFRKAVEEPQSRDNVVMYEGDSVHVAFTEDVIYVSGEVYVPSPVLFTEGASLSYYIRQAGGYKEEAEDGKTVVFLPGGKKWDGGDILPGSSIFVPKKVEKEDRTWSIIRDLVTILASLAAITVALVQVTK